MTEDLTQILAELVIIEGESIGWIHLCENVYVHQGGDDSTEEILVIGTPTPTMAGLNLLLVT